MLSCPVPSKNVLRQAVFLQWASTEDLIAQIFERGRAGLRLFCTPTIMADVGLESIIWECLCGAGGIAVSAQITGVQWCRDGELPLPRKNKHYIALDCDAIIMPRLGTHESDVVRQKGQPAKCTLWSSHVGRYDDCAHFLGQKCACWPEY